MIRPNGLPLSNRERAARDGIKKVTILRAKGSDRNDLLARFDYDRKVKSISIVPLAISIDSKTG